MALYDEVRGRIHAMTDSIERYALLKMLEQCAQALARIDQEAADHQDEDSPSI